MLPVQHFAPGSACAGRRRANHRPWLVTLAPVLALALVSSHCVRRSCANASCDSGISVKVNGDLPGTDKQVTACLDGNCLEVAWPLGSPCASADGQGLYLSVCVQDGGAMIRLQLGSKEPANGTPFELSIVDGDGAEVFHASETVRYTEAYPNGEDCPGRCRYANFRY